MAKRTNIQGDSYSIDFSLKSGDTLGGDWSGQWAIVDMLGTGRTTLASGVLGQSTDQLKFEMRIVPADTQSIAVGDYFLVVQVTNTTINFNKEIIQDEFKITKQGI